MSPNALILYCLCLNFRGLLLTAFPPSLFVQLKNILLNFKYELYINVNIHLLIAYNVNDIKLIYYINDNINIRKH